MLYISIFNSFALCCYNAKWSKENKKKDQIVITLIETAIKDILGIENNEIMKYFIILCLSFSSIRRNIKSKNNL